MKTKVILAFILSLLLAYLTREVIGDWLMSRYAYSGSWIGPSNGEYIDGFLISFSFFCALIVTIFSGSFRAGIYLSSLAAIFYLLIGSYNPQLWLSLLLLAAGLGLAWVILQIKEKLNKKESPH